MKAKQKVSQPGTEQQHNVANNTASGEAKHLPASEQSIHFTIQKKESDTAKASDLSVSSAKSYTKQAVQQKSQAAPDTGINFTIQKKENNTGLPDHLKSGIENLSGHAMDDVKVHYNSSQPAQLNAYAYAQGNQIHIAPGQEKHLAHEAWHVVQQKQGRVKPTKQLKSSVAINDDAGLEKEADVMGAKALSTTSSSSKTLSKSPGLSEAIQRRAGIEFETGIVARNPGYDVANGVNSNWVTQDEQMLTAAGWGIVSDNSKLEFVTDPPVTTAMLGPIVNNMMGVINAIPARIGHDQTSDFHTAFPGLNSIKNYVVLPYGKTIVSGSLQGTVGIPFHRLFDFFNFLTHYKLEANESLISLHEDMLRQKQERINHMADPVRKGQAQVTQDENMQKLDSEKDQGPQAINKRTADLYHNISDHVNTAVAELQGYVNLTSAAKRPAQQNELNKLKGLLHFVGQYAVKASLYKTNYLKISFPVLARSSFSSMFHDLPRGYGKKFISLATEIITKLGLQVTQKAFASAEDNIGPDAQFTLAKWLESIKNPGTRSIPDDSKGDTWHEMQADKMTAPSVFHHHNTDKSMGAMGLDNGLVVVELRSLKHFTELTTHDPNSAARIVNDLANIEGA